MESLNRDKSGPYLMSKNLIFLTSSNLEISIPP